MKSDIDKVISELNNDPNVEFAQKNYILYPTLVPTDEQFNSQWALSNEGQYISGQIGLTGIDVEAEKAWDITTGKKDIIIGVLDTGIDINHPDLKDNIYINKNEIPGNGIDDDKNGYIDDISGFDFFNKDATVYDKADLDLHGTHISGIIAASSNNYGISGISPNVEILPLKFINGSYGYTSDALEAIEYAKKVGVKIINASWGGEDYNPALESAINDSGILFVGSAGNNGADSSIQPNYPASFNLPNVISVTAVDNKGELAPFSNYGAKVDIAAPGVSILSTIPDNKYAMLSGTSMAAPYVAGTAALLYSIDDSMTPLEAKAKITENGLKLLSLKTKVKSESMLNSYNALNNEGPTIYNYTEFNNLSNDETTVEKRLEIESSITILPEYPSEINDKLLLAQKAAEHETEIKPVPTQMPTPKANNSTKESKTVINTQALPSVSVSNVTETSLIVSATFPRSGINGNGLFIKDNSTGQWRDIYGSYSAASGTYYVSGLTPGTSYDVQLVWYTDDTHSWTRQERFSYTKTKSYNPTLSVSNITQSTLTIDVTYPISGKHGNGLFLLNQSTNTWSDIYGSWNATSGRYTISNLSPGTSYVVQQVWYTDYSNDWTRQEKLQTVSTLNAPEILYRKDGNHVFTNLEIYDTNVLSTANHTRWLTHLDKVYESLLDLVGTAPYSAQKIEIKSTRNYPGGWAVSGNPILWYQKYIKDELVRVNNYDDWSFGIMHEISHNFDSSNWNFDAEFWANTKMYYAVEQNNSIVTMNGTQYTGSQLKNYYKSVSDYGYDKMMASNSYHNDFLTYTFIRLKDIIGWQPFKSTFRDINALSASSVPSTKIGKLNLFLSKLKEKSNYDVLSSFSTKELQLIGNAFGGTVGYNTSSYTPLNLYVQIQDGTQYYIGNLARQYNNTSTFVAVNPDDDMLVDLQNGEPSDYFVEDGQYWVYLHKLSNYMDIYQTGNNVYALSDPNPDSYSNLDYEQTTAILKSSSIVTNSIDSATVTDSVYNDNINNSVTDSVYDDQSTQDYKTFTFIVFNINPFNKDGKMNFQVKPVLTFGFKPKSTDYNIRILTAPSGDGPWTQISSQSCENLPGLKGCIASIANRTAYWKASVTVTFKWKDGSTETHSKDSVRILTNNLGNPFPLYRDSWSGQSLGFPRTDWVKLPESQRTPRDPELRQKFIAWYVVKYGRPNFDWADYDIHHIRPLAFGGTNDFSNLIAIPRTPEHQKYVTPWFANYSTYDPDADLD
ncbi:S8 family serine peptidase [Paenibacillus sp. DMB5]|uniref:S8 family serine peptidase n=1 Tax=Paenibacillus sp. DMB5 TaxID=1780103 RepID=UPI000AB68001|nr:S8 family serine peptidase [Paenibacillus sp. DMB5]